MIFHAAYLEAIDSLAYRGHHFLTIMTTKTILAILLIALGALALVYHGFNYKTRNKAVDFGPLEIITEETHTVPLPPILGAIALISGVGLLVLKKKSA